MHIPADIIRGIAAELAADRGSRGTLASLALASRDSYDVCTPLLYAEYDVSARRSSSLLRLSVRDVAGFPGFDSDGGCKGWEEDTVGDKSQRRTTLRRLSCLSHVKRVVVRSLPPDHVAENFAAVAASLSASGVRLLPRVKAVCVLADAINSLRTWTPDTYERPHNPPFLEALSSGARPKDLCVAFPLTVSSDWEVHRDMTTAGQYALVRKIELLASTWSLETVTYHDIVFQVPPAIPSTTNIYHFAPHVVPHPLFARRHKFPTGQAAIGLPGPEWNIRPWQMGLAVKNLFPSGSDHGAVLHNTRWVFCSLANHILTKGARDDDDSTGVWYVEVEDMVKDSIRVGLERDMPARDMKRETMVELWERISYERAHRECGACHRDGDEFPVMSVGAL